MPRAEYEPLPYLSKRGKVIFRRIVKHIEDTGVIADIDTFELSMLANCFDLYEVASTHCNDQINDGKLYVMNGSTKQVIPEYNVMQQQYDKILKHSSKFGLNPGDRAKIFGGLKVKIKKDPTSGLDDPR